MIAWQSLLIPLQTVRGRCPVCDGTWFAHSWFSELLNISGTAENARPFGKSMKSILQTIRTMIKRSDDTRRIISSVFLLAFLASLLLALIHSHPDVRQHDDCTMCVLLNQPVLNYAVFTLVMIWVVCRNLGPFVPISFGHYCLAEIHTRAPPSAA
jgi:hypothetical protein